MTDYALDAYRPEDREDYLRLLERAWGRQALSPEEFAARVRALVDATLD